jgi:hypothetical protein
MQKLNVFLSHVNVESKLALLLREHLTSDFIGLVDVFQASDRFSIPAGGKWLDELTKALKRADLHLIICSPDATSRPWIQFEAGAAHLRGIPIIPLCHSGLTFAQLPFPLSENEGIELSSPEGLAALYERIAKALGSGQPKVDFDEFAKQVSRLEREYAAQRDLAPLKPSLEKVVEKIRNPKALCISSRQFTTIGYENQLQIVLNAFPAVVPHQRVFSSRELQEAITRDGPYDVIHIAAYVCPRSGDLYFSDVNLDTGASVVEEPDILAADALSGLLDLAKAKLVVIGSCDSLVLGATLVNICHVIAARDMVSPKMMAAWVEAFYTKLSQQQSLSEALDFALKISQAPMRFYARQTAEVDMVFTPPLTQNPAIPSGRTG